MSGWQHSFFSALMAGSVASDLSRSSLRPSSAAVVVGSGAYEVLLLPGTTCS